MLETILQIIAIGVGLLFIFAVAVPRLRKIVDIIPSIDFSDPVTHCQCYVEQGCSHVDGMHCEMKSCSILKDFRDGSA